MGSLQENKTHHSDILIVGAGIFGTSTAYHLSLTHPSPSSITVLDRAPFPSPQAASSDINKIVRADYSDPFYMDLAYEAMDEWAKSSTLKPFYHQTGWVMLPETDSDIASRTRANFKRSGRPDPSSDISHSDIRSKWDGVFKDMDMTGFGQAYYNPEAGRADASAATEALMKAAVSNGIQYKVGEVKSLIPSTPTESTTSTTLHGVLTTSNDLYTSRIILLCTGAWAPWLLHPLEHQLSLPAEHRITTQLLPAGCITTSIPLSPSDTKRYDSSPVFIYGNQGEIMPSGRDSCIKFTNANTFTHSEIHPETGESVPVPPLSHPQSFVPEPLKLESQDLIRRRIPSLLLSTSPILEWRICHDILTRTQDQLICPHPSKLLTNLYFATGGSFHSWKFLPTIGKYVVKMLNGTGNEEEKERRWSWKIGDQGRRGAHEKVWPRRAFADFI